MNALTKITLHGQSAATYGDDCTEADAAGYRKWLKAELERAFPGADVDICEADSTYSVRVDGEWESYDEELTARDAVDEFLSEAWFRCPWDWTV